MPAPNSWRLSVLGRNKENEVWLDCCYLERWIYTWFAYTERTFCDVEDAVEAGSKLSLALRLQFEKFVITYEYGSEFA